MPLSAQSWRTWKSSASSSMKRAKWSPGSLNSSSEMITRCRRRGYAVPGPQCASTSSSLNRTDPKVTASDLDSMLGDTELRDTKLQFWRRYRQRYPAEVHPSDATLSRVTREMSKRMLCVFHIWKVRSLQFQLHTSTKKRKVGENLFTEDKEDEEQCDQDWETYLNKLHTLLLAYAHQPVMLSSLTPSEPTPPNTWRYPWMWLWPIFGGRNAQPVCFPCPRGSNG